MPLLRPPLHTLYRRVADLVARFDDIARTRMVGVPLLNPALQVEAVGFTLQAEGEGELAGAGVAVGILVTPWFMNLVRLPLRRDSRTAPQQPADCSCGRRSGPTRAVGFPAQTRPLKGYGPRG